VGLAVFIYGLATVFTTPLRYQSSILAVPATHAMLCESLHNSAAQCFDTECNRIA